MVPFLPSHGRDNFPAPGPNAFPDFPSIACGASMDMLLEHRRRLLAASAAGLSFSPSPPAHGMHPSTPPAEPPPSSHPPSAFGFQPQPELIQLLTPQSTAIPCSAAFFPGASFTDLPRGNFLGSPPFFHQDLFSQFQQTLLKPSHPANLDCRRPSLPHQHLPGNSCAPINPGLLGGVRPLPLQTPSDLLLSKMEDAWGRDDAWLTAPSSADNDVRGTSTDEWLLSGGSLGARAARDGESVAQGLEEEKGEGGKASSRRDEGHSSCGRTRSLDAELEDQVRHPDSLARTRSGSEWCAQDEHGNAEQGKDALGAGMRPSAGQQGVSVFPRPGACPAHHRRISDFFCLQSSPTFGVELVSCIVGKELEEKETKEDKAVETGVAAAWDADKLDDRLAGTPRTGVLCQTFPLVQGGRGGTEELPCTSLPHPSVSAAAALWKGQGPVPGFLTAYLPFGSKAPLSARLCCVKRDREAYLAQEVGTCPKKQRELHA